MVAGCRSFRVGLLFIGCLVSLLLVGCGGGSSSTQGESPPPGEPSKDFVVKGGNNEIAEFGDEGSATELEAASAVLEQNLKARQEGDFAAQCSSLGKAGLKILSELSKKSVSSANCTKELKDLAEPLASTEKARKDNLSGSIAALRVKGEKAYALFHGSDGKDWTFPMEREDGEWKVGALIAAELESGSEEKGQAEPASPGTAPSSESDKTVQAG